MKTHVEFQSKNFPPYPNEEDDINPGIWGKKLAELVRDGLREQGLDVLEPLAEDWGWMVEVRNDAFRIWIGCANYEELENGFLCFIEPSKPFIRRMLFGKIRTESDVAGVQKALDIVLSSDPTITGIRWWTEEDFVR